MTNETSTGYVLDNASGRIRLVRESDPQAIHDAIARARGIHLMTLPVVYANGTIMGEMIQVEGEAASVTVHKEAGLPWLTVAMPVTVTEAR